MKKKVFHTKLSVGSLGTSFSLKTTLNTNIVSRRGISIDAKKVRELTRNRDGQITQVHIQQSKNSRNIAKALARKRKI